MTSVPIVASPAGKPPRVWKFWGSLIWGLVALGALMLAQFAVLSVAMNRVGSTAGAKSQGGASLVHSLASNGAVIAAATIASVPAILLVLWFATRFARHGFSDYLALRWPSRRDAGWAMVYTLIFLPAWDLMSASLGIAVTPPIVIAMVTSARGAAAFSALLLALCVAAPITEELTVRGFLYRGWSESRLGVPATLVLTSACWALIHVQYSWYFVGEIFCIGLLLGYWRFRSGSTLLTVAMHAVANAMALAQAMWFAGRG